MAVVHKDLREFIAFLERKGELVRAISLHFRPDWDLMITPRGMADMEKPSTYPRGVGARMGMDATTKLPAERL